MGGKWKYASIRTLRSLGYDHTGRYLMPYSKQAKPTLHMSWMFLGLVFESNDL